MQGATRGVSLIELESQPSCGGECLSSNFKFCMSLVSFLPAAPFSSRNDAVVNGRTDRRMSLDQMSGATFNVHLSISLKLVARQAGATATPN